jgi:hypothetical protein
MLDMSQASVVKLVSSSKTHVVLFAEWFNDDNGLAFLQWSAQEISGSRGLSHGPEDIHQVAASQSFEVILSCGAGRAELNFNLSESDVNFLWCEGKLFSRNPFTLCYDSAVGFKGFSNSSEVRRHQHDFRSERNLAVAILRQAWHEAVIDLCGVKETSRKDYSLLKKKAIEWICSDDDGFPYWCQLADVDHTAVRQKLSETLHNQYRSPGLRIANVQSPIPFPLR